MGQQQQQQQQQGQEQAQQQQRHRREQQQQRCGTRTRTTDATCALCIDDYEVGDTIVWSHDTTKCSHVYHQDCLLEWLTKGKKHCPVCRSWFVPGSSIHNQKLAHGMAWKRHALQHEQEQEQLEREERERDRAQQECETKKE